MMKHHKALSLLACCAVPFFAGCANLAPDYVQPPAPVAAQWPQELGVKASAARETAAAPAVEWTDLLALQPLRDTVTLALQNSRDVRLAVLAIEKARATYNIQEAATWPTLNGTASMSAARTPGQASASGVSSTSRSYSVGVGTSAYEVDVFGRVRNLQEAALQNFLSTEQTQRSVQLSLVAEVTTAWLTMAADRSLLVLAQDTLRSQQATFDLVAKRQQLGADSSLTLAQAQTTVDSARRDVAAYESQVRQDKYALELLVGTAVPEHLLPTGAVDLASGAVVLGVPAGVPSSVLQRRPDVLAAEHVLKASNADIGAARAALFPRISLTSSVGTASRSLSNLFQGGAWSFVPSLTIPLLDGGASRAELRVAEVSRDIQVATYEKTVQTAFTEVADALAVRASLAERLSAQNSLVGAWQRSLTLSQARYQYGSYSYLNVLDAQRSLYTAQQARISLQLADLVNRMTLLKALGGSWAAQEQSAGE